MSQKFRFSPIKNKEQLFEAIEYTHFACHKLCKQYYGKLLPIAGNVGIFSHYNDEFSFLTKLREELTIESENWNNKYYHLKEPIIIQAKGDVPQTTYTFLYARQPDSAVTQVGDVDFFLPPDEYATLKQSLIDSKSTNGIKLANHPTLDMIMLEDSETDAWGFIATHKMSDELRS